ncbi:MAG TPA: chemotaxis protein MotB [Alphaproteobacteria bacterium]|nr:chemotaxis protein MotB [Alphaproteobacteria bacterium]
MAWMITFTDLITLMLTFFVLLFSMSNVKVDKWKDMIDALSLSLNPSQTKSAAVLTAKFNISAILRKRAINLDYLASVLQETLNADQFLRRSRLIRLDDRLIIALPGDLVFETGSAVMVKRARKALFDLGGILRNIGNKVGVNGYSDPTPLAGGEYVSNWELSLGRAAAVANELRRSGYSDDITAYGYSDSRFNQLPKVAESKRRAMARRVDIVIMPTSGEF